MAERDIPYTASDMREIADQVEKIEAAVMGGLDEFPGKNGDWRWGMSVEIYDDMGYVAGVVKPQPDGWLGFYPKAVD